MGYRLQAMEANSGDINVSRDKRSIVPLSYQRQGGANLFACTDESQSTEEEVLDSICFPLLCLIVSPGLDTYKVISFSPLLPFSFGFFMPWNCTIST